MKDEKNHMATSIHTNKTTMSNKGGGADRVVHDYHDYSHVTENHQMMKDFYASNALGSHKCDQNFPVKLHYMLSELEADGLDLIVSWQPHGRCFLVHDQERFVSEILPLWFRQSKFASFQRQLNLYGFKRLTHGRDKGGYYHEFFLRGKRFLAHRIERIKVKGNGGRKPGSPETEPNFYSSPFLPHPSREAKAQNTKLAGAISNFTTSASAPSAESQLLQRYFVAASLGGAAALAAAPQAQPQAAAPQPPQPASAATALSPAAISALVASSVQNAQMAAAHTAAASLLGKRSAEDIMALSALQQLNTRASPALTASQAPAPGPTGNSLQNASTAIVAALLRQQQAPPAPTNPLPAQNNASGNTAVDLQGWLEVLRNSCAPRI